MVRPSPSHNNALPKLRQRPPATSGVRGTLDDKIYTVRKTMNTKKLSKENTQIRAFKNFFRFGPESRIKKMQHCGQIYMKNFEYFVELEKKTQQKGKGDIDEARMFSSNNVSIYLENTDIQIGTAKFARIYDSKRLKNPVFCITQKNLFDDVVDIKDGKVTSIVQFDKRLETDFEDLNEELYVLIITDGAEFIKRIETQLNSLGHNVIYGDVIYRDTSHFYKVGEDIEFNGPLHKNPCFSYQEEFRFVVDTEVEDNLEIFIGSITDISVAIPFKNLSNGLKIVGGISNIEEI